MAVQVSHPSAFKGYGFGICPQCSAKALYQGRTRNPVAPISYVRCRKCGYEAFNAKAAGLQSI
jgi:DNA-directed RNA polymerase subunit RPC12/RpoP